MPKQYDKFSMVNEASQTPDGDFRGKWRTLQAIMVGTFMAPLDASIVNTILPYFTSAFNTDISVVQWIPTVYLLVICSLILLFGRLGDIIGHKVIFLTGVGSFAATSLVCGLSRSIWMLIAARVLQGIAASMLMSVGPAIVTAAFPSRERGKALGTFATSIAVALAVGPTLGGLITEYIGWRFVFFVNVPIGIIAVLFGLSAIPRGIRKKDQKLDWPGAVTVFIFLLSLLLYANRAREWGWDSAASLMLLLCAVVSGAWFIRIEMNVHQPMIHLDIFKNRIFALGNLSMLLSFVVAYTVLFLMPFYLTLVMGLHISEVGLILAAFPLVMLVVSPISGTVSDRIGSRVLTCTGMIISCMAMVLFSRLTAQNSVREIIGYLLFFSLGVSIFQSPNSSAVMGSIPRMYLGIASGVLANMRNLGMVLGIAISGAVFYSMAPVALSSHYSGFNANEIHMLLKGFHRAYLTAAGISFIAVITSFFSKAPREAGQQESEKVKF